MKLIKYIKRYSLVTLFLVFGLFLILSGKSILHLLPLGEKEIAQCRIPATMELIRIYEGNGGATTAFWYKVTYQKNYFTAEVTILTSYGSPDFGKVNCLSNSIELIPIYSDIKPYTIQYGLIRSRLVKNR